MAVPVLFVFVFFLRSLALLWRLGWLPLQTSSSRGGTIHSSVHRLLKPPLQTIAPPVVSPHRAWDLPLYLCAPGAR